MKFTNAQQGVKKIFAAEYHKADHRDYKTQDDDQMILMVFPLIEDDNDK